MDGQGPGLVPSTFRTLHEASARLQPDSMSSMRTGATMLEQVQVLPPAHQVPSALAKLILDLATLRIRRTDGQQNATVPL